MIYRLGFFCGYKVNDISAVGGEIALGIGRTLLQKFRALFIRLTFLFILNSCFRLRDLLIRQTFAVLALHSLVYIYILTKRSNLDRLCGHRFICDPKRRFNASKSVSRRTYYI